ENLQLHIQYFQTSGSEVLPLTKAQIPFKVEILPDTGEVNVDSISYSTWSLTTNAATDDRFLLKFNDQVVEKSYEFGVPFKNEFGRYKIVRNPAVELSSNHYQLVFENKTYLANQLRKETQITRVGNKYNSSILEITTLGAVANKTTNILKQIISVYNELELKKKQETLSKAKIFLDRRIKDIERDYNRYQGKLNAIPSLQQKLIKIDDQDIGQKSQFRYLIQKREEIFLEEKIISEKMTLIDRIRTPTFPIFPNRQRIKLGGFALGFFVYVLIIFSVYLLDKKIYFKEDIEQSSKAPLLATLPFKPKQKFTAIDYDDIADFEAFRNLRNKLSLLYQANSTSVFMVTGINKTTMSSQFTFNLGLSFAQMNKKVALVDARFRNRSLTKLLHLDQEKGIADYLEGRCDFDSIIHTQKQTPNLLIVPSGKVNNRSVDFLSAPTIAPFFERLKESVEVCLIEVSPIYQNSEGILLNNQVNCTLVVAERKKDSTKSLEVLENMRQDGLLNNPQIVYCA
ncbi:MAG: hypothetical protein AAGJ18_13375, partial [Bacteroidota bacterium]